MEEKENKITQFNSDNETIKSLEYFVDKLKVFLTTHQEDYILKTEFDDFVDGIINETTLYISQLYDNEILLYKTELIEIANEKFSEVMKNELRERPITLDFKSYYEKATNKIISIASRQVPYTNDEAINTYSNIEYLEKKYKGFVELIEWCNAKDLSVIPDRIMFCAYMRITLDTYSDFLNSTNEQVQNVFKAIENYIISLRLNAGEIGTRNSGAIKTNVSYDKVGNSLSPKDSGSTINKNLIITNEDIFNKMRALGFDNNDFNKRRNESNVIDYTK